MTGPVTVQLGMPQYVLVPADVPVESAVPNGSWDIYTDFHRWDDPAAAPSKQYCVDDVDVALARVTRVASQSGVYVDELAEGPGLLDVQLSPDLAVDLTGPVARNDVGVPANYPANADDLAVRAQCRAAGAGLFTSGAQLIAVSPAEPSVGPLIESIVDTAQVTIDVTRRRTWSQGW